jgi:hypothetical protein
MNLGNSLRKGGFVAATTLALAFGTIEALAAPANQSPAAACSSTWIMKCDQLCQARGYAQGFCDVATGACICQGDW